MKMIKITCVIILAILLAGPGRVRADDGDPKTLGGKALTTVYDGVSGIKKKVSEFGRSSFVGHWMRRDKRGKERVLTNLRNMGLLKENGDLNNTTFEQNKLLQEMYEKLPANVGYKYGTLDVDGTSSAGVEFWQKFVNSEKDELGASIHWALVKEKGSEYEISANNTGTRSIDTLNDDLRGGMDALGKDLESAYRTGLNAYTGGKSEAVIELVEKYQKDPSGTVTDAVLTAAKAAIKEKLLGEVNSVLNKRFGEKKWKSLKEKFKGYGDDYDDTVGTLEKIAELKGDPVLKKLAEELKNAPATVKDRIIKEVKERLAKTDKAKTDKEKADKEKADKEKTDKAAAGTRGAPGTSRPTTITKGYVEDKDGRITETEVRSPDGNLISIIITTTDKEGKVIKTTTYKNGTGEGTTTTSVPATDSKQTNDPTEYNPLDDPNLKKGKKRTLDMAAISKLTGQFKEQQTGPQKEDSGNIGGGDYPTDQSDSYTKGTIGKQPDKPKLPNQGESPGQDPPDQPSSDSSAKKPGLDVKVVGTASPGKCKIVSGQLVAVQGYPKKIAGMTVKLTGPVNRTAKSSGSGSFSFAEIPAGDYTISVKGWDYGMTKANLKAPSGKSIKIVLKGSCPYLYVWTGQKYERENDIYSTARLRPGELIASLGFSDKTFAGLAVQHLSLENIPESLRRDKSYRDYYRITHSPKKTIKGNYMLKIVERAGEHSFTDLVQLLAVERPKDLEVGITREGRVFYYKGLQNLISFSNLVESGYFDGQSVDLYDRQSIELSLPAEAFHNGILAITWQGFLTGFSRDHTASPGRPSLALQRQNPDGDWQTMDWIYPRDEETQNFFVIQQKKLGWDTKGKVRLVASNCLPQKFHRINRIAWEHIKGSAPNTVELPLNSAKMYGNKEACKLLQTADGLSMRLGPSEETTLWFDGSQTDVDKKYSFIFVAEGFYIPASQIRILATSK